MSCVHATLCGHRLLFRQPLFRQCLSCYLYSNILGISNYNEQEAQQVLIACGTALFCVAAGSWQLVV